VDSPTAGARVLAHQRIGAGPRPVILLHGLLGSARNLATLAREIAGRRGDLQVVAFDLTGHGASPALPPGADGATLAGDVLTSARALGLATPLMLVGHSLGGRVALRVAQLTPAIVAAVTLLDIAPGPLHGAGVARVLDAVLRAPPSFASRGDARAHFEASGLGPALADWLLLNLESAGGDTYRWRIDRPALAELHAHVAREDLWPVVEGARDWVLRCVRGAASPAVSDDDARRLEAARGPVVTIAGAGHFLHTERPREVLEAVVAGLG
jgi:esterase